MRSSTVLHAVLGGESKRDDNDKYLPRYIEAQGYDMVLASAWPAGLEKPQSQYPVA